MKKITTLKIIPFVFTILFFQNFAKAQLSKTFLDINDVKAIYLADGRMFWDATKTGNPMYYVPKNNPKKVSTIFAGAFMIGGVDGGGQLHTAGMTYRQRGVDFWPGPLNTTTCEPHEPANWNRIWNVKKSTIDYHRANYKSANYVVPQEILDWPGNGPFGCSPVLAPFFDRDGDGLYEPLVGDYPIIKGDQAVFFILNDNGGEHTHYPGGLPLKIEIHGMAWARTSTNKFLDQATFLTYTVFNRSASTYYNTRAIIFTDFDLGNPEDDYISTDTNRNLIYCYNADSIDEDRQAYGYGLNPPAQGVLFLDRKLNNSIAFTNQGIAGVNSDPEDAVELYRYLNGFWADGNPLVYGTTDGRGVGNSSKYIFTGNMCDETGWIETQPKGDRRGLGTFVIDTFLAGSNFTINLAFVYARGDPGISSSECKILDAADYLQAEFNSGRLTGINTPVSLEKLSVSPNPVTDVSIIKLGYLNEGNFDVTITDLAGRILKVENNIDADYKILASDFTTGMYIIKLRSNSKEYVSTFIVK